MQDLGVFGGLDAGETAMSMGPGGTSAAGWVGRRHGHGTDGGMMAAMAPRQRCGANAMAQGWRRRRWRTPRSGWRAGVETAGAARRFGAADPRSSPSSAPTSPTPPSGPPPSPPPPDGTAEVEFTLPESLTTWKVKTWTMGLGTKVGQAESEIVTTKDLLVRLQAPRFFVEKDEVVLSANVHNKLKTQESRPGRAGARRQRPRSRWARRPRPSRSRRARSTGSTGG